MCYQRKSSVWKSPPYKRAESKGWRVGGWGGVHFHTSEADKLTLIPDSAEVIFAEFKPTFYIGSGGTKARLRVLHVM